MDTLELGRSGVQLGEYFPVPCLDVVEGVRCPLSGKLEHARALDPSVPAAEKAGTDELPHALVADAHDLGSLSDCDALGLGLSFHGARMPLKLCRGKVALGHGSGEGDLDPFGEILGPSQRDVSAVGAELPR